MPRVSVITALHDKGAYVAQTIRSVLAQTVPDWEMIVVENGSSDDGPRVVRQFSDPRLRLVVSPQKGPGAARNFGYNFATAEWILFLDADDLLAPDYLEERLGQLQTRPDANLIVGGWEEFPDGQPDQRTKHFPAGLGGSATDIADAAIAFAPWVLHAALTRRSRFGPSPAWLEHLDALPYEDAAFWFPIVLGATPVWSEKTGAFYRLQTASSRNEIVSMDRALRGIIGVVAENTKHLQMTGGKPNADQTGTLVRTFESAYRRALRLGDRQTAALALKHASFWLGTRPVHGRSMHVRRRLGLRLFNLLRFGAI